MKLWLILPITLISLSLAFLSGWVTTAKNKQKRIFLLYHATKQGHFFFGLYIRYFFASHLLLKKSHRFIVYINLSFSEWLYSIYTSAVYDYEKMIGEIFSSMFIFSTKSFIFPLFFFSLPLLLIINYIEYIRREKKNLDDLYGWTRIMITLICIIYPREEKKRIFIGVHTMTWSLSVYIRFNSFHWTRIDFKLIIKR